MAEIFISYKSDRRPAAEYLAQILERNGFSAWYDYGLLPGARFEEQLTAQLDEAKVVLVLWCSLAAQSEWVAWEADRAAATGKYLPVLIEGATKLPARFQGGHYLDVSRWSGEPQSGALNPLLLDLGRRLGRQVAPDVGRLNELHRLWETLGAPPLREFALRPAKARAPAAPPARTEAPRVEVPHRVVQAECPQVWRLEALDMPFVGVPAGEFRMGATKQRARNHDPDANARECPLRRVRISAPFWLGQHPVTNAQYRALVQATGHRPAGSFRRRGFDQPLQPVTEVDWDDAVIFCRWLTEAQLGDGWRAELPTEAQWEWAARADTARKYPWGDEEPDETRAVYGGKPLAAVGRRPAGAGPFGAHDQAGQVWEWCRDAYAPYPSVSSVDTDPCRVTDKEAPHRVMRGGAWSVDPEYLRAAYRYLGRPDNLNDYLGFRVALFGEPGR